MEKKIIRLVQDCWTTCNRIGMYHSEPLHNLRVLKDGAGVTEKYITDDLVSDLPAKLVMLINKNFDNLEEVLHFFAQVNKNDNYSKFVSMLNELGGFTESEFVIYGSIVAKRPFNYSAIPVASIEYVS